MKHYEIQVVRHEQNGKDGYRHTYHAFASAAPNYPDYRIVSTIGPQTFALKEHWIHNGQDEEAIIKGRVSDWHPDADIVTIKQV